jgi:hypothetical protein
MQRMATAMAMAPSTILAVEKSDMVRHLHASPVHDGDGGNGDARQIDREDATPTRKIARIDTAIVRFSAPPAEGETKTHARAIGAPLLERTKELVDIGTSEPAALILDLDEHALGAGPYPEGDRGPGPCELEGVLQEVSDDRGEDLTVSPDRHPVFDRRDGQTDATSIGLQR